MLKLRTILLHDYLYIIILIISLTIAIIYLSIPRQSLYSTSIKEFSGKIVNYNITSTKATITIKNKEKILLKYYFKSEEEANSFNKEYSLNDNIKVKGEAQIPKKSTSKNLFNYKSYLKHKGIFYIVNVEKIEKISSNKNFYYYLKQKILDRLNYNPYLYTFILGDKSYLSQEAITSYQENGLSHLFAISGMHISLLATIITKILKKLKAKEKAIFYTTSILLLIYLSITNISSSIIRGVLFYILFSINKIYYFYIKPTNLFIITLSITILINPNYLYDIAFYYSFSISLGLILHSKYLQDKNYFKSLLKVSFLSFIISLPISLYTFHQINLLSIILNLIYVPFISIIIFPLSLIAIFIPFIVPVYNILIKIMEVSSIYLSKISFFKYIFPHLNITIYLIYYIFIIIILKTKFKYYYPLIIILLIHYNYPHLQNSTYLKMIDVGQGDSILIHSKNETILIDTGGILKYKKDWDNSADESSIVKNITIPLLKSLGIKKINFLILTHGDYDHMGEAKYLIDDFKVENIIINSGEINYLEEELIKKRKDVIKGYEGLQISCGDFELIQLNEEYQDENTGSQIYYVTNGNINILLTGDASIESELNLINKYNLPEMDILKVGHHGSKTSSSEKFIDVIKPKYSLISCGKDNKFNHPNKSTLNNLQASQIYRTDKDGTITFTIKNNNLEIEKSIS